MRTFDDAVFTACKESKIRYTRYADDLTFSGSDFDTDAQVRLVDKQLSKVGLSVNAKKLAFCYHTSARTLRDLLSTRRFRCRKTFAGDYVRNVILFKSSEFMGMRGK